MATSNFFQAHRNPLAHRMRVGRGYVAMQPLEVPEDAKYPLDRCNPPPGSVDGSVHILASASGVEREFQWIAPMRSWRTNAIDARRMGFKKEYLSAHGWSYVRPKG